MDIEFISQPYDAGDNADAIGHRIISTLKSGEYKECTFCVAFVRSGGVALLLKDLKAFIASGGKARVIAGIDNGLTSVQGLEQLLIVGAEVYCVEVSNILYHPKQYLFRGATRTWMSLGSSNLTASGLFRNLETNLTVSDDDGKTGAFNSAEAWAEWLLNKTDLVTKCEKKNLLTLMQEGKLVDERTSRKNVTRKSGAKSSSGAAAPYKKKPQLKLPSLPVPFLEEGRFSSLSRVRKSAKAAGRSILLPTDLTKVARTSAFFAMTLSAFDCSHKTGVPGTPEIAIPEAVTPYFPPIGNNGNKYQDVYFAVRVNVIGAPSTLVNYRLWQRPPGTASGHADWRINIGHATIDQTGTGGGDIILFERLDENDPPYEVWIIKPNDPKYSEIHAHCTNQVKASGAAGTKHYGIYG